jgi:hypothetical protein
MKSIELSQGKFAKVDDVDLELLSQYSWWFGSTGYAFCSVWIGGPSRKHKNLPMHRLIMGVNNPLILVDHINGDKLDNRRGNLRLSNKSTNSCNRPRTRANTTGYKGVTRHGQCARFISQIRANGKNHYLGLFTTAQEAALAYNKAAKVHFGEFAYLNDV